jgi:hypothetical protein
MEMTNSPHTTDYNQEMFSAIRKAQQQNSEITNKMIGLSIEQKVLRQKDVLTQALVDLYI